jgi:hypothetical protein
MGFIQRRTTQPVLRKLISVRAPTMARIWMRVSVRRAFTPLIPNWTRTPPQRRLPARSGAPTQRLLKLPWPPPSYQWLTPSEKGMRWDSVGSSTPFGSECTRISPWRSRIETLRTSSPVRRRVSATRSSRMPVDSATPISSPRRVVVEARARLSTTPARARRASSTTIRSRRLSATMPTTQPTRRVSALVVIW